MTYTPTRRTDHASLALSRMLETTRKPFIGALLLARVAGLQRVESATWEVADLTNVAFGFGVILDWIGQIVGRGRRGLDDTAYRAALQTQILINRSSGVAPDWTTIANREVPGTWTIHDFPPASAVISIAESITVDQLALILADLSQIRAAGTRVDLEYSNASVGAQFRLGWTGDAAVGQLGFGWSGDVHYGGKMSDAVTI